MHYNGPYDQPSNRDASYVNGNPSTNLSGSIPPAAALEYPQREIVNYITDNSIAPSNLDLHQFSRGLQNSSVIYGVDTGTVNALQVAFNPKPLMQTPGMTIRVKKIAAANTGALTIDIGLGPVALVKADGSAFAIGEMPANMVFEATWDGAAWKTINFLGSIATNETVINNYNVNIPYCVDTSATPNTIVGPYSPPITTLAAGDIILVKLNNSFTGGPVTILVNALSAINLKRGDGQNPYKGDGFVGQILLLEYDGTVFQIVNSLLAAAPLPILLADIKPDSTQGGTYTGVANPPPGPNYGFQTRDLNTVVSDPFGLVGAGLVTLNNNQFTLGPGNWNIRAKSPMLGVWYFVLGLFSVPDNTLLVTSQSVGAAKTFQGTSESLVQHAFLDWGISLSAPKTFELRVAANNPMASIGLGIADVSGHSYFAVPCVGPEIYTTAYLTWSR